MGKKIKAQAVRQHWGGCSSSTLYRLWAIYKVIPPPVKIRNINYWDEQEIVEAFKTAGQPTV
jgi:hypothetical protein